VETNFGLLALGGIFGLLLLVGVAGGVYMLIQWRRKK
jgi:hypothetical protein